MLVRRLLVVHVSTCESGTRCRCQQHRQSLAAGTPQCPEVHTRCHPRPYKLECELFYGSRFAFCKRRRRCLALQPGSPVTFISFYGSWILGWLLSASLFCFLGFRPPFFPPFSFHCTRYFIDLSLKCGSHSLQFTTRGGSDYGVEKSWFMEKKEKNYSTVYTVTEEPGLSLSVRGQGCSTASTEFIYTRMDTSILPVSLCIDITLLSPQLQIDSGWNQK